MTRKKEPNAVDRHVGSRVRMRRMLLGLSQEKLGDDLGLTFQQVQKYEKGTNRIGASRLQQIAHTLQVPVAFFFEGQPGADRLPLGNAPPPSTDPLAELGATRDGLALAIAFNAVTNPRLRAAIVAIAEASLPADPARARAA